MVKATSTPNLALQESEHGPTGSKAGVDGEAVSSMAFKNRSNSAPTVSLQNEKQTKKIEYFPDDTLEEDDIILDEDAILALSDSDDFDDLPGLDTISEAEEDTSRLAPDVTDSSIEVDPDVTLQAESIDQTPDKPKTRRSSAFTPVSGKTFRPIVLNTDTTDIPIIKVDEGHCDNESLSRNLTQPACNTSQQHTYTVNEGIKQPNRHSTRVVMNGRGQVKTSPSGRYYIDSHEEPGKPLVVRRHSFTGTSDGNPKELSASGGTSGLVDRLSELNVASLNKRGHVAQRRPQPLPSSDSESEETKRELNVLFKPVNSKSTVRRSGSTSKEPVNLKTFGKKMSQKTTKVSRRYSISYTPETHQQVLENLQQNNRVQSKSHLNSELHRNRPRSPLSPKQPNLGVGPAFEDTTLRRKKKSFCRSPINLNVLNVPNHKKSTKTRSISVASYHGPHRGGKTGMEDRTGSSTVNPNVSLKRRVSCPAIAPTTYSMFEDDDWDDGRCSDHYLMTMHLMANHGESNATKKLLQPLIDLIIPKLKIFNIVERGETSNSEQHGLGINGTTPSMGVVLFLQEDFGMDRILHAQKYFHKSPWQLHHRDRLASNIISVPSNSQDFYFFSLGMPLWAVRQVHGRRDNLRFTVFVSDENYDDTIQLYSTLLNKDVRLNRNGFCFFTVFRSNDIRLEIQLALKKLPKGMKPRVSDMTMLQFKIDEIGQMVPLLPNQCFPISDRRWQTTDLDGNRILLLVPPSNNTPNACYVQRNSSVRRPSLTSMSSAYESATEFLTSPIPSAPRSKASTPPSSVSSYSFHSFSGDSDTTDEENVLYI